MTEHSLKNLLPLLSEGDRAALLALSPVEQRLVLEGISDSKLLSALAAADYTTTPVSPREFFTNSYYIGDRVWDPVSRRGLYPTWLEELCFVLDPRNEIYEWLLGGSLGSGKCLEKDSLVLTSRGILRISDAVAGGEGFTVRSHTGEDGEVYAVHSLGEHNTIKISTKYGYSLNGRPEHRIRCLSGDSVVWKQLSDVGIGDIAILDLGSEKWSETSVVSDDEAELIGAWVGDGHWSVLPSGRVGSLHWSVGKGEVSYREHLTGLVLSVFGKQPKVLSTRTCDRVTLHSVEVGERWRGFGCHSGAHTKIIPDSIFRSGRSAVCRFLRGLFDTDGYVGTLAKKTIELSSVSERLVREVQVVLLNLGIASHVRWKKTTSPAGTWRLTIGSRRGFGLFRDAIGFSHPKKMGRLDSILASGSSTAGSRFDTLYGLSNILRSEREKVHVPFGSTVHSSLGQYAKQNITREQLFRVTELFSSQNVPIHPVLELGKTSLLLPVVDKTTSRGECFDLSVYPGESYVANGFPSHNTTCALLCLMYWLYRLTCMRSPHEYLGLMQNESVDFFFFNINLTVVEDNALGRFENYVNTSPYFRELFPEDRRRKSTEVTRGSRVEKEYKLSFPPYFSVIGGTGTQHQIGRNIVCSMLDEANFVQRSKKDGGRFRYDSLSTAYTMYTGLKNRIESRFLSDGRVQGLLVLISSAGSQYDFLEQHKVKVRGDRHVHLSEFSRWEISPWKYSSSTFRVFIGGKTANSRILQDGEEAPLDGRVVSVPKDFLRSFEQDLPLALRDVAGIPSDVSSPLLPIKEQILDTFVTTTEHPFDEQTIVVGHLNHPADYLVRKLNPEILANWDGPILVPKHYRSALRHIHVDLGLTNDSAGISMGCISGVRVGKVEDSEGRYTLAETPQIWMDFMLRVDPPQKPEQISIEAILQLIRYLRDVLHFHLGSVTFDGFASEHAVQLLQNELSAKTRRTNRQYTPITLADEYPIVKVLSVDKNVEPYKALRMSIVEKRLQHYPYPPFDDEVVLLQIDLASGKVDHLPGLTKDVSDTVAGVVFHCQDQLRRHGNADILTALAKDNKPHEVGKPVGVRRKGGSNEVDLAVGEDYKIW